MKTVILVGAGATVAASIPEKPEKPNPYTIPPLDSTFFEFFSWPTLDMHVPIQNVSRYVWNHHGIKIGPSTSLEAVFNCLFADVYISASNEESLSALRDLLWLYTRRIVACTYLLDGASRYGVCGLVGKLLDADATLDLTVMTYNHDLMIERSLAKLSKQYGDRLPFSVDKCYGIAFKDYLPRRQDYPRVVLALPRTLPFGGGKSIRLLKLHGSLNWVRVVRSLTDAKDFLREPKGPFYCTYFWDLYSTLHWLPKEGRRSKHLVPVILPPIHEKAARFASLLAPIRQCAERELQDAERLIIFGYSLPDADFLARNMIRRALNTNTQLRDLVILDLDPGMCSKVAYLRGGKPISLRFVPDVPSVEF